MRREMAIQGAELDSRQGWAVSRVHKADRAEILVVGLLTLAMFAWSTLVAVREPVWSPIDEGSHWLVATSLVEHGQYPRADQPEAVPPPLPRWANSTNIQALQPPVNYAVLGVTAAVVERVATLLQQSDAQLSVRAMRLTNSAFFSVLVLLLWLCGRVIAPGNLALALGLPAADFVFRGPVIDSTRAGNDVLVGVLSTLALYLFLRWRDSLSFRRGVLIGSVIGLATLCKYTGVCAFVLIGLVLLARTMVSRRRMLRPGVSFLVAAVLTWVVLVAPWFAFLYLRYGELSGKAVMRVALPPVLLMDGDPARQVARALVTNFRTLIVGETPSPVWTHGQLFNTGLIVVVLVLAAVGAVALVALPVTSRLSRLERVALVLGVPAMVGVLMLLSFTSTANLISPGRYDLPALLPMTLLVAGASTPIRRQCFQVAAGAAFVLAAVGIAAHDMLILNLEWPPLV